jgi:hypothetical protein
MRPQNPSEALHDESAHNNSASPRHLADPTPVFSEVSAPEEPPLEVGEAVAEGTAVGIPIGLARPSSQPDSGFDVTQDGVESQSEANDSPRGTSSVEVTEEAVKLDLSQAVTSAEESCTTELASRNYVDRAPSPVKPQSILTKEDVVYPTLSLEEDDTSEGDDEQDEDSESDGASPKRSGYNDTLRLLRPESALITPTPELEDDSVLDTEDDRTTEIESNPAPPSPTTNLDFFTKPASHPPKVIISAPETDLQYPTLPLDLEEEEARVQNDRNSPDELSLDLDATETFTTMLEDDKAILRNFLSRAAASKASKTASMSRRESLQNRRDSDAVRHALASPRPALQEKDANLSPVRDIGTAENTQSLNAAMFSPLVKRSAQDVGLDSSQSLTAADDKMEDELAGADTQDGSPRRRSSRNTRSSKIPHPPSAANAATPNKIPVRTDGGERVLLNRTEAQQLADLVRKNTRKNKGGAIAPLQRLVKLQAEALTAITDPASPRRAEMKKGVRGVRWREVLEEFSTAPATADLESSTFNSEEAMQLSSEKEKEKEGKSATPRTLRRLKNPATTKGTPSRNVLNSTLLPEEVQEELQAAKAVSAASSTSSASTATAASKTAPKKSKIKPPSSSSKNLLLNPSVSSLSALPLLAGKENVSQLLSPAKKLRSKMPVPAAVPSSIPVAPAIEAKPVKRGGRVKRG